ncbi:MAG: response regulator [Anaerolineales bacterium]|nr:response regulator [Anaerolineales bacterium]
MSTILVVEDEPNVRKLVVINLIKRGYQVREAENGTQALQLIRHQKPSLLILDIKLPDLTGWDILDNITNDPAMSVDFPVLVMTASPIDQADALLKYKCIVQILIKPFNIDMLITAIQRALPKS